MLTYQDFMEIGDRDEDKMNFVRKAVNQYKASEMYKIAVDADLYYRKRNPDIANFTKMLYTVTGRQIPDTYSSNFKIGRAFFPLFIEQEVQYLLSNGVTWENGDETADSLGTKTAEFDTQLQDAAHKALCGACSYGFWNLDHVDVFSALEFVPLYDENNGAMRGGIRFWQIDASKPFRATLYEEDGYTDYIWNMRKEGTEIQKDGEVLHAKRSYVVSVTGTDIDEEKIYTGENYPTLPIVPFWGNKAHQSELVGLQEQIFVYDVIKSGFCNNVEEASYVYWAISNAPGMDEEALAEFISRVKRVHAAVTEDNGSVATPHVLEAPTQSRSELLERLERDLFKDAMAFDPEHIASGSATATQIKASYNLLKMKTNGFEYCVLQFINGILALTGIEDKPTFTRDQDLNVSEEIQAIMMAETALDEEYVTRKILTYLGDADQADEIIERRQANELSDVGTMHDEEEVEGEEIIDGDGAGDEKTTDKTSVLAR